MSKHKCPECGKNRLIIRKEDTCVFHSCRCGYNLSTTLVDDRPDYWILKGVKYFFRKKKAKISKK